MSTDYFIGVNALEIDRLRTQHETWHPETELLWQRAGFPSMSSIVDLGCGPGFTSLDLARIAPPTARITAVDKAAPYLAYLSDRVRALAVTNVDVMHADISKPGSLSGSFDGAFCRWFLAFLRDDMDVALANIRAALRPGGTFVAMEYLTLHSVTCSPPSAAFDAHTRAWFDFYAQHGGDSSVGAGLPPCLSSAGFTVRSVNCVGGMADPTHRWWAWWGRLIQDFGPKFVELGLMRPSEWADLQRDWAALSQDPHAFIYTPILLQVIAERA
jgi:cyclopropane fatty-acyl-phospholipid synthase-like methyltransferase